MRKIISAILAMSMVFALTSCDGGTTDSSEESVSSTSSATKESSIENETEDSILITEQEAASIAQEHIENKLAAGDVSIEIGSDHTAKSFDTVSYGDANIEYSSTTNLYHIKCKATCWGYDSYGDLVDKYKFDASVYVDAETGFASSSLFILSKT